MKVRLRGTSDVLTFGQIFIDDEYKSLRGIENVETIIDLGANVGFASVYFLSCFPKARVLSVEPDAENVAMCSSNLRSFGERSKVLHGAAWSECTMLKLLTQVRGREWGRRVERVAEASAAVVTAWDVPTLITMTGSHGIDLLKIDIEGSETEIFDHTSNEWLKKVRNLCIELHGRECEEAFFDALRGFDYEIAHTGELTICRNLRAKAETLNESSSVAI